MWSRMSQATVTTKQPYCLLSFACLYLACLLVLTGESAAICSPVDDGPLFDLPDGPVDVSNGMPLLH